MIDIEHTINSFLQKQINFVVENKSIKKGRLVLFNVKDFHLIFILKINNEQKRYEIPYPFNVYHEGKKIVLDYTIDALSQKNDLLLYKIMGLNRKKTSKLFDTKLIIQDLD